MFFTMHRSLFCLCATCVSEVLAAVPLRIAVQNLSPVTRSRDSDSIVMSRDWSEVENCHDSFCFFFGLTHEPEHALLRVAAIDPLKARGFAVEFVQSSLRAVSAVEIRHPLLNAAMRTMLKQVPFQTALVGPFGPLSELSSHKQQFFRRLCVHVREQKAQIGKLLPQIYGHFSQQSAFDMDDLIMGEWKNEILMIVGS